MHEIPTAHMAANAAARRLGKDHARPPTGVAKQEARREAIITQSSLRRLDDVAFQPLTLTLSICDIDLETSADCKPICAGLKLGSIASACLNSAMARSRSPSAM